MRFIFCLMTLFSAFAGAAGRPAVELMQKAQQHARSHGATYVPIFSPVFGSVAGTKPVFDLQALLQAGFPVVVWTVDKTPEMDLLLERHVSGIISDRPDLLAKAIDEHDRAHPAARLRGDDGLIDPQKFDAEAHRGGRDLRPENTLPSFESGLDQLMNTLETDTGVTADHVSLISHNQFLNPETCRRVDGAPYTDANKVWIKDIAMRDAQAQFVCDKTFRGPTQQSDLSLSPVAVAFAKAGKIKHPYSPTNVEQLFEFVAFYADYYRKGNGRSHSDATRRAQNASQVRFNLETKTLPHEKAFSPELFVETLNHAIARNNMEQRCFIQSFDFQTLVLTQERYPKVRTVYLTEGKNLP